MVTLCSIPSRFTSVKVTLPLMSALTLKSVALNATFCIVSV